jgi:RNA polymerase sigma-70 factor (subfamily 1)
MDNNEELDGLLIGARKGDSQALGALLMQLRPWVRHLALCKLDQRLLDRLDYSDIVQEVHVRALAHFGEFHGNSVEQLLAWLLTVLKNAVKDQRRIHHAGKRDVANEQRVRADLLGFLVAHATTPSRIAIRNERLARLWEAIQQLPPKQQQVIQLRLCELPFDEVAQAVGVTVGNARQLWVRAIERLKELLGDEDGR